MKNLVLKLILLVALPVVAWADARQDGDAAFAKGDYTASVRAYQTAISAGSPSAGLYYNLATAQMKAGERPQAALNLRRALMLDPGMADARVSLSGIERSMGVPAAKESWTDKVAQRAPLTVLYVLGAVVFWIGAFLLLPMLFRKQRLAMALAGVALILVGGVVFSVGVLADPKVSERQAGVIVAGQKVNLLSAPADQSTTVAQLPAASCVKIIRPSGEWTYCESAAGEKGWLPTSSVQSVLPAT